MGSPTTIREAMEAHALELWDRAKQGDAAAAKDFVDAARQVWGDKAVTYHKAERTGPWYILETEPQRESTACSHLIGRRFEPYLPMALMKGVRAGRSTRDIERPMFRGYLFIRLDIERDLARVRNLPGVRGLLRMAGENKFACPADADIEFIREQEKEALNPKAFKTEKLAPYKVGRAVKIKEGPFGGFTGKIWQLAENERITILLDVFARPTPAIVDLTQIEAL